MFKIENYKNKKLTLEEELELFRVFNSERKVYASGHTNFAYMGSDTEHIAFEQNVIINQEKARDFLESLKEEK